MTVLEIVTKYLKDAGFEGLYSDHECACELGDLEPCGEMGSDCTAGYISLGCPPECGEGCDFHIVGVKPASLEPGARVTVDGEEITVEPNSVVFHEGRGERAGCANEECPHPIPSTSPHVAEDPCGSCDDWRPNEEGTS